MDALTELVRLHGTVVNILDSTAPNRSGKIKLQSGEVLCAFPDKLNLVQMGNSYAFDVKANGRFLDVKAVTPLSPTATAPRQPVPQREALPAPQAQQTAREFDPPPPRKPAASSNGNQFYRPTAPRDAERMFVCSTLNAFIQTGRINISTEGLVQHIKVLRAAWEATFGQDEA
jgi:hypothetical protein